ncbi:MAG: hypothetical protein CME61_02555 [Halobacteriovoraceae bacterium]|nr:hypothetical protein [Halobacteriovoraceae bacterium]
MFEEIFIESPVEIYRLCIKLLKKEMKELKTNHLFKGKAPSFNDLVASAYETQLIDKTFLEELYKIQEFWSPKKTKWEKVKFWVSIFTQAGTIFLPPPYNYLVTFSILAIENLHPDEELPSYEHSIFGDLK